MEKDRGFLRIPIIIRSPARGEKSEFMIDRDVEDFRFCAEIAPLHYSDYGRILLTHMDDGRTVRRVCAWRFCRSCKGEICMFEDFANRGFIRCTGLSENTIAGRVGTAERIFEVDSHHGVAQCKHYALNAD